MVIYNRVISIKDRHGKYQLCKDETVCGAGSINRPIESTELFDIK